MPSESTDDELPPESTAAKSSPVEPAKAAAPPGKAAMQHAIVVGIVVVVANAMFFFLSERYYAERAAKHGAAELANLDPSRINFLIFSVVTAIGAIAAAISPRHVGHAVAVLAGFVSIVGGFAVMQSDIPATLGVTLLVLGSFFVVATKTSWQGSRAGWATLVALCGVIGIMTMFGAPTLGRLFGVGIWVAMILPGMLYVGATALCLVHDEYR